MFKKLIPAALAATLLIGTTGCHDGGGGGYDPYYRAWYDVYGVYCYTGYPAPGCNFYWSGRKIVANEDPYYSSRYFEFGTWRYTDSWGYTRYYVGYAWLSPNGILYDNYGYALNTAENPVGEGRDLMASIAEKEEAAIQHAGRALAKRFSTENSVLSDEQGVAMARTLADWASLGRKSGRTSADVDAFSKRLFGLSLTEAKPALEAARKGDIRGLQALNEKVATHWNVSPETSREILQGWFSDELRSLNVAR